MWRCAGCGTRYPVETRWCWTCLSSDLIVVAGQRPRAAATDRLNVASARDLAKATWDAVVSRTYPDMRMAPGALVGLYGPPAAGKSTMLLRLLDGLDGASVLLSAEERLGPAVGQRLARLGIRRRDIYVASGGSVDDLMDLVRSHQATALAVDSTSVTTFTPTDLRAMVATPPPRVLVVAIQVTKAQVPSGPNSLLHELDVAVECRDLGWSLTKSRYQPLGIGGPVLPDKRGGEDAVQAA